MSAGYVASALANGWCWGVLNNHLPSTEAHACVAMAAIGILLLSLRMLSFAICRLFKCVVPEKNHLLINELGEFSIDSGSFCQILDV